MYHKPYTLELLMAVYYLVSGSAPGLRLMRVPAVLWQWVLIVADE